jgi:hypothetical protein
MKFVKFAALAAFAVASLSLGACASKSKTTMSTGATTTYSK